MSFLTRVRQSLITRLILYFALTAILIAGLLVINFTLSMKHSFEREILPNLAQYMAYMVEDIGVPPDIDKARSLSRGLSIKLAIEGPDLDWISDDRMHRLERLEFRPAPAPYDDMLIAHRRGHAYVLLQRAEYKYIYAVARPFARKQWRGIGLGLALFIAIGLLFVLIRSSLRPLGPINDGVRAIGRGELDLPITPRGSGEFRDLAAGINDMTAQIRQMLQAKHDLLLAISHELRSPLTRARLNVELLPQSAGRQALIDDIREMEGLVSTILESERLNQRHAVLDKSRFDAKQMISATVERYFTGQSIATELQSQEIFADRMRLELLAKNLLDNALKYSNTDDTTPVIRLFSEAQGVVIEVEDYGVGMSQEQLEQVSQAFYRADPARQRTTGGFGLGLYLCRQIVAAHGGDMHIYSSKGQGTRVRVWLPGESTDNS